LKGIILAAGKGTRLGAATLGIGSKGAGMSKPLIPTFDKPTIYYPLSDLIAAGINDVLVIAAPDNVDQFRAILGDGSCLGMSLSYDVQEVPRGIAEAFVIAENFIGNDGVALTFGDNIFSGDGFTRLLREVTTPKGAMVFARHVRNPQDFGVVEFDVNGRAISLEEKPLQPKSPYAVPGMYFYDSSVVEVAKHIEPSARGELEITTVNEVFLEKNTLAVTKLDSDTDWFDTGTPESLLAAAEHVMNFQRQNEKLLGSPEAAAFLSGFIGADQLKTLALPLMKSRYGQLLSGLATNGAW
jgi:glucose-1-phosphate thymidylyltransferase